MKKTVMAIAFAAASMLFAQEKTMALADARGKIDAVVNNPAEMTEVMQQLSAADQVAFLAEVNAAIEKMPGSADEQAAKFLDVETAALKGAKPGNMTALVAEVYATVPPNALTVINESFAAEMFNRAADPSKTYTDAQFTAIAKSVVNAVQERAATADNGGVRSAFAILMMLRASNGQPTDLRETLVNTLTDPATKELAQNEWLSPALGDGQEKTYDPMLGAADAGEQPNSEVVMNLAITHATSLNALLGDVASDTKIGSSADSFTALLAPGYDDPYGAMAGSDSLAAAAAGDSSIGTGSTIPRTTDPSKPYYPGHSRGYANQTW